MTYNQIIPCMVLLLMATLHTAIAETPETTTEEEEMVDLSERPDGFNFHRPDISAQLKFNGSVGYEQLLGGVAFGIADPVNWWLIDLGFNYAGPPRPRIVQERDNYFFQFWERRYQLALEARKMFFPLGTGTEQSIGLYGSGGGAYGWGNFKGTERSPESLWGWQAGAGMVWERANPTGRGQFLWMLGYQMNRLVPDSEHIHRVELSFFIVFSDKQIEE